MPVSTRVFTVFRSVVECGYFFGKDYWGQEFKALRLYRGEDAKLSERYAKRGVGRQKGKMKGESHVLGIPISKTQVIWAFPSHTTLAIWVRVKVKVYTGNAHITRVLGMGMPKTRGCAYHGDTASFPQFPPVLFSCSRFFPADPTISEPGKGPDEYPTTSLFQHSTLRLSLPRSLAK